MPSKTSSSSCSLAANPTNDFDGRMRKKKKNKRRKLEKRKKSFPMPLLTNGNIRTGILLLNEERTFFKLNRPTDSDPSDGGHEMEELEVISECCHYTMLSRSNPLLADFKRLLKKRISLISFDHDDGDDDDDDFDSRETSIDVRFPGRYVANPRPLLVRSKDSVRVVAWGQCGYLPFVERFWIRVLSVTSTGIVTGVCVNDLALVNLKRGDFLAFPISSIFGVIHGPSWAYKSNGSSKDFGEKDIQHVAEQAGSTRASAIQALVENRGSIAESVRRASDDK